MSDSTSPVVPAPSRAVARPVSEALLNEKVRQLLHIRLAS